MLKSPSVRAILICLALALGTLLVYAPVRHFDFVNYDDQSYVINNFNINRGLSWEAFKWSFNAGYASNWHPLTWLSHALDCQLYGTNAGPAHVTSVLLHAATAVLLFLLLQGMTRKTWRSAAVAALFAWHPLHVESVAWISERKDVLSGLFFVLTIWAYWCYTRESKEQPRKALIFFLISLALFALGLMAKPMLVTLPFLLLLLDFWPLARLAPGQGAMARFVALCAEKIPFLALAAGSSVLTVIAQARDGAVRPLAEIPMATRIINAFVSYCRYMGKLAWPRKLSVIYPYNFNLTAAEGVGAALLLAGICVVGIYWWSRRPYWLVGWLWFFGALVPVIGVVQVGGQAMADRYSYLPSIGLFVAVCWTLGDWVETRPGARAGLGVVAAAALGLCLYLTHVQVLSWRDGGTLSEHSIAVDPNNFMGHAALASYLLNKRELDRALAECEATLKLNRNYPPAHEYMGDVLYLQGHYEEAARQLQFALKIDPYKHDVNLRLGDVYLAQGLPELAEQQYRAYLTYDRSDPSAHCGLGKALAMEGKLNEACWEFAAAIHLVFMYPEAHYQLALTLAAMRRPADAIGEYRKTLRISPRNAEAMNNLAWILAAAPDPKLRNGTNAVALAERACLLTTNRQPLFLGTLADAYAEAGRYDDAVKAAQQAHDVALAQTNEAVAARNLQLEELYRAHQAWHEE